MKHFLLVYLVFFLCLASCKESEEKDQRTVFFPKTEEHPNPIPSHTNVWVFILAGQSNMAGRGQVEPVDTIPDKRILTINKEGKMILAKEPLHFYEPNLTGLDCGLSFGKTLLSQLSDSISILLIPTAVGGSSIRQWLGDSTHRQVRLLSNLKEKIEIGNKYGEIKGLLWHQGESDANEMGIADHAQNLSELFRIFRTLIANDSLPVMMGELGSYSKNNDNWHLINEEMKRYTETDPLSSLVPTSDLIHKGDSVHFNSDGQRKLGERFANEFLLKFM